MLQRTCHRHTCARKSFVVGWAAVKLVNASTFDGSGVESLAEVGTRQTSATSGQPLVSSRQAR